MLKNMYNPFLFSMHLFTNRFDKIKRQNFSLKLFYFAKCLVLKFELFHVVFNLIWGILLRQVAFQLVVNFVFSA